MKTKIFNLTIYKDSHGKSTVEYYFNYNKHKRLDHSENLMAVTKAFGEILQQLKDDDKK